MQAKYRALGKKWLSRLLPNSRKLRHLTYLPELHKFHRAHGKTLHRFPNRRALYQHIQQHHIQDDAIDFLEFGVYRGASLKYWLGLHPHPDSQFYGFDTFSGLPEEWVNFTGTKAKHHFDTGGVVPEIEDSRVQYLVGTFQETLPDFVTRFKPDKRLIIHCDADLYGATLFVLMHLQPFLQPGTIILFDEFSSMLHEFRAWQDYCEVSGQAYEVLAATISPRHYYTQVAVRLC